MLLLCTSRQLYISRLNFWQLHWYCGGRQCIMTFKVGHLSESYDLHVLWSLLHLEILQLLFECISDLLTLYSRQDMTSRRNLQHVTYCFCCKCDLTTTFWCGGLFTWIIVLHKPDSGCGEGTANLAFHGRHAAIIATAPSMRSSNVTSSDSVSRWDAESELSTSLFVCSSFLSTTVCIVACKDQHPRYWLVCANVTRMTFQKMQNLKHETYLSPPCLLKSCASLVL